MLGKEYKNISMVTLILGAFVLFMVATTVWVVYDVSTGRSCVRTCDHDDNTTPGVAETIKKAIGSTR